MFRNDALKLLILVFSYIGATAVMAEPDRFGELELPKGNCDFSQEKKLSILPNAIKSNGLLFIAEDNKSIVWQTTTPIPEKITISEQGIQGQEGQQLPVPASFAKLFLALLTGNHKLLDGYFKVTRQEEGARLIPNEPVISEHLSELHWQVREAEFHIQLLDKFKDETHIKIYNCSPG